MDFSKIIARVLAWSKHVKEPECAMCGVPLTDDLLVLLPIDGGAVEGPLCVNCDLEFTELQRQFPMTATGRTPSTPEYQNLP